MQHVQCAAGLAFPRLSTCSSSIDNTDIAQWMGYARIPEITWLQLYVEYIDGLYLNNDIIGQVSDPPCPGDKQVRLHLVRYDVFGGIATSQSLYIPLVQVEVQSLRRGNQRTYSFLLAYCPSKIH